MSNKDILMKALNFETPSRVPWVPYVGVHGAYLLNKPADEYLQSVDLMYEGVAKAREEYNPDGLPITFDLQVEAEALGCEIMWAKDNPPSVTGHILEHGSLSDLKPFTEDSGRIPLILETTERLIKDYKDDIGLMALPCGPFTLGLHLMGSKIITNMIRKPDEVKEVMAFCGEICRDMTKMYLDRGVEIVAIVDPMTSQISPKFFDDFVVPAFSPALDLIRERNAYSMIFVCGNATRIIPNLASVEANGFAVDENLDFKYTVEEARKQKKVVAGNLPLTIGLLFGEVEDNIEYAQKCIEIGQGPGFILAPGCDMPYHTSPENVKAVTKLVHGK